MTIDLQQPVHNDGIAALSAGTASPALTAFAPKEDAFAHSKVHKRTFGEKAVDFIVYPVINNFIVIGTSVVATYLTKRGDTVGTEGSAIRKVGNALKTRGDWTQEKFQKHLGMNEKSADMAKMVFFSFADGTVLTPFVKLLEDRREQMARWIDSNFGSKQADDLVYQTEPKQTWKSVIGGRLATLTVVLATAIGLDQKINGRSTNDRIFDRPSEKVAEFLESHTNIKKRFPKLDTHFFSKTLVFEAVYASICTAGLYFLSRAFVKHSQKYKNELKAIHESRANGTPLKDESQSASKSEALPETIAEDKATPLTSVSETTHLQRVAAAPVVQEVTA